MSALLAGLWPALTAALLLGLVAGWLSGLPRGRVALTVAASLLLLLAVVAGVAFSQIVPGAYGLWVETAGFMLAAYLAGCALGGAGRSLRA